MLADKLAKATVIERSGEKIGLIGLTPQDTDELASPGDNVTFSDPIAAVQEEVDRLTAEGVRATRSAAREKLPVSQMATKVRARSVSIRGSWLCRDMRGTDECNSPISLDLIAGNASATIAHPMD